MTDTSATSKTKPGYKLVSTDTNVGGWSEWQDGAVSSVNNDSLKREVQTRQVVTGTYYKYGHYCGRTRDGWETFPWSTSAFASNAAYHEIGTFSTDDGSLTYMGVASDTGTQNWAYYPNGSLYRCSNSCYRWYRMGDPSYTYKTQYRYRDTHYVYHFEQIGEYGDWSDVKPTSYYQLQERTLYRGRNETPWAELQEKNDTESIHVEGSLLDSDDVSGKTATVFVYKETNTDPLQSQIEYMDEITIGAGNTYSLTIIPRENLSKDTGDFIVAFAMEGASRLVNAKVIPAPKAMYTVNFIAGGKIISTQTVSANSSAVVPDAPELPGMRFVRWSSATANVREDIDAEAVYQEASYVVVYVDKLNGSVDMVRAAYNDPISRDYPKAPDGYRCKGWDASTVSGDMIVNALYEKNNYTVTFMDASGENVVEKKTCSYGGSVLPPSYEYMTAGVGQRITGWSMENEWRHVTKDLIVYPIVEYEKTAATPYTTQESTDMCCYEFKDREWETVYPELDLLSDADGAKIYYTTNGSDPEVFVDTHDDHGEGAIEELDTNGTLYTGPISISSDMVVKAICIEDGKNVSDVADFPISFKKIAKTVDADEEDDYEWFGVWDDIGDPEDPSSDPEKNPSYKEAISATEKARSMGKGSVTDTDALMGYGSVNVLSISGNEAAVTVAKGNRFSLDGTKGTFKIKDHSKKKYVSVSKKGVVKAKKDTGGEGVDISFVKNGALCNLKVYVIAPSISSNVVKIKKSTAYANVGQSIDIFLNVPLNALYDRVNTKNDGLINELAISFCSDDRYHITGLAVNKGTVKIPIYVNGKKYTFKIKIKG